MVIELAQHDLLFDVAHEFAADLRLLFLVGLVHRIDAAVTDIVCVDG